MNAAEKKYSTCEHESLAVIFSLKTFRLYLLSSKPFELIADHQALQYMSKKKYVHGHLAKWMDNLAEYWFFISLKPGASSKTAKFLSTYRHQEWCDLEEERELALPVRGIHSNLEPDMENLKGCIIKQKLEGITGEYREITRKMAKRFRFSATLSYTVEQHWA